MTRRILQFVGVSGDWNGQFFSSRWNGPCLRELPHFIFAGASDYWCGFCLGLMAFACGFFPAQRDDRRRLVCGLSRRLDWVGGCL